MGKFENSRHVNFNSFKCNYNFRVYLERYPQINNFMMTLVHEKKCDNYKLLYTGNINNRNSSITYQSEVCKSYQGQLNVLLCIRIQADLTIAFRPLWFVFPVYEFFYRSK